MSMSFNSRELTESCMLSLITGFVSRGSLLHTFSPGKLSWHLLPGNDFGVKKVYKSPKSIHRADAKGLTSSSKLSVSCVLTLQTLPLITFTPSYARATINSMPRASLHLGTHVR